MLAKLLLSTFIFSGLSFAGIPIMDIQFGGPLNQNCSFVNNEDVVASLQSTLTVLGQIQETEVACQNLLINSKTFIDSSLASTIEMQKSLFASKENKTIIENLISSNSNYAGELDFELLAAEKEIALQSNKAYIESISINQTMQLGSTLFNDLTNAPIACSHSFGQDILAPALAVTGQVFSAVNPAFGALGALLSSIVTYADRVLKPSYRSFKKLTQASNFHLTYKCAAKNIEKIMCNLEEQEKSKDAYQSTTDQDEFAQKIYEKALSYDTENSDFRKFHHLKRHRYRISKIIEDLDNIYRSPETAQDIQRVVNVQTLFTALSLVPRLNPLKSAEYVRLMKEAGLGDPNLNSNWDTWNRDEAQFNSWIRVFYNDLFNNPVKKFCSEVKVADYPWAAQVYVPGRQGGPDCDPSILLENKDITDFINLVIAPTLVFVQKQLEETNDKIKRNANVHTLYTNVINQMQNTGNPDYDESKNGYTLPQLLELYKKHAEPNKQTSLRLFALDIEQIADAIYLLTESESIKNSDFDAFAEATKLAYSKIAEVSSNGQAGSILYRSIVESKISSYLDGVAENYIFSPDEKLGQDYVQFNFYANDLDTFNERNNNSDSEGSANIALMGSVKTAFYKTFGRVISKIMKENMKKLSSNNAYKRNMIHSCAIFYPMMENGLKGSTKKLKKACYSLLKKEKGIKLFMNSKEVFPLEDDQGQNFTNSCYYNNYEDAVMRHRINKAKRNRGRFRI